MVLSNGCNRRSLYFFMTKWLHTKLIMTETTPKTVEVCQRHSCRFRLPQAVYVYITVHGVHSRHYSVLGFERIRWCQGHPLSGIHCHSTQRINITIYMYAYYFFHFSCQYCICEQRQSRKSIPRVHTSASDKAWCIWFPRSFNKFKGIHACYTHCIDVRPLIWSVKLLYFVWAAHFVINASVCLTVRRKDIAPSKEGNQCFWSMHR